MMFSIIREERVKNTIFNGVQSLMNAMFTYMFTDVIL